ncbi:hypothetical protein [Saccharopolyspora shandongensis]|uniref:hypothetical protein n=1 Tax=Saccharopolyspora shandongensis TaxID=418495 RepID=UPI0015A57920|nr:hypothetical protein [Saccharopolyspora shandongensis]
MMISRHISLDPPEPGAVVAVLVASMTSTRFAGRAWFRRTTMTARDRASDETTPRHAAARQCGVRAQNLYDYYCSRLLSYVTQALADQHHAAKPAEEALHERATGRRPDSRGRASN